MTTHHRQDEAHGQSHGQSHGQAHGAGHHAAGAGGHAADSVGHIAPTRIIIVTGLALLVLTWITVFTAGIHLGEANIYIALAIAVLKGSLVALFFMHLRWDRPFNAIVFISSLMFVALFLAFAITDSAEYQDIVIKGDAPKVVETIAESKQAAPAPAPPAS